VLIPLSEAAKRMGMSRSTLERYLRAQARGIDMRTGRDTEPSRNTMSVCAPYGAVRPVGCAWQFDASIADAIGEAGNWLGGASLVSDFLNSVRGAMGHALESTIGDEVVRSGRPLGKRNHSARVKVRSDNSLRSQSNSTESRPDVTSIPIEQIRWEVAQHEAK